MHHSEFFSLLIVTWTLPQFLNSDRRIIDKFPGETKVARIEGFLEISCPGKNSELIQIQESLQLNKRGPFPTCPSLQIQSDDSHPITPKASNDATNQESEICSFRKGKVSCALRDDEKLAPECSLICLKSGRKTEPEAIQKYEQSKDQTHLPFTTPRKNLCISNSSSTTARTVQRERRLRSCSSGFPLEPELEEAQWDNAKITCSLRDVNDTLLARWLLLRNRNLHTDCNEKLTKISSFKAEFELKQWDSTNFTATFDDNRSNYPNSHKTTHKRDSNQNHKYQTFFFSRSKEIKEEKKPDGGKEEEVMGETDDRSKVVLAGVLVGGGFLLVISVILAVVVVRKIKTSDRSKGKEEEEKLQDYILWGPKSKRNKRNGDFSPNDTIRRGPKKLHLKSHKIVGKWKKQQKIGPLNRWSSTEEFPSEDKELIHNPGRESPQPLLCSQDVARNHSPSPRSPKEAFHHILLHSAKDILTLRGVRLDDLNDVHFSASSTERISSKYGSEMEESDDERKNESNLTMSEFNSEESATILVVE